MTDKGRKREKGKERTISIDRVKACQDADDPAPDGNETDDQQKNDIVIQTRCGRVLNKPFRFRSSNCHLPCVVGILYGAIGHWLLCKGKYA